MNQTSGTASGTSVLTAAGVVKYAYDEDGKRLRGTDVTLLSSASIDVRAGEIHALVGENGAGKTTLIKVIAGAIPPDGGRVDVDGQEAHFRSTVEARKAGISVIWQELNLAPQLTVAENMFLGRELRRGGRLDHRRMAADAAASLAMLGAAIDTKTHVGKLSTSQQQMVEIAKAMGEDARVLILDEPTASLSRYETERLFELLRELRDKGIGIVLVTHRFDEIFAMSDRATVLKDGRTVGTFVTAQTTSEQLIETMVGRKLDAQFARTPATPGDVVLDVCDLRVTPAAPPVSLQVRAGEIVGLAGLVGSGRTEVARGVVGADKIAGGAIRLRGQDMTHWSLRRRLRGGVAFVPEDRKTQGLVLPLSIERNLTLASLASLGPGPYVSPRAGRALGRELVSRMAIQARDNREPVYTLSGGNQQRVVVGKWFDAPRFLYVLDEPTRGVDVSARYALYQLMQDITAAGGAILMISSDLPEVLTMSDRIYVMREGAISAELDGRSATESAILERMLPEAA